MCYFVRLLRDPVIGFHRLWLLITDTLIRGRSLLSVINWVHVTHTQPTVLGQASEISILLGLREQLQQPRIFLPVCLYLDLSSAFCFPGHHHSVKVAIRCAQLVLKFLYLNFFLQDFVLELVLLLPIDFARDFRRGKLCFPLIYVVL